MNLHDQVIGRADRPILSFEFFPTSQPEQREKLLAAVQRLNQFEPRFISMTYGAGGSTRTSSIELVETLIASQSSPVAAHLTCVGASRDEVDQTARSFHRSGCRHIVALRGDPSEGVGQRFAPHHHGYRTSSELVAGLRALAPFEISVGAYCERHPESPNWETELDGLRRKVDAGADRAITQFFFGNDLFEAYRDRVSAAGINLPIVPGILPIHNIKRVCSFAAKCGASVPEEIRDRFGKFLSGDEGAKSVAVEYAAGEMLDLRRRGVDHFHFYTMNRSDLIAPILTEFGVAHCREKMAASCQSLAGCEPISN